MKSKIMKKVLAFIWARLQGVDWKVFLYSFWTKYVKGFLKKLVEKTDNKFDDMMLSGIEKIVETFLNPSKEEKEMSEQDRSEAVKNFFRKIWEWVKKIDWKGFLYKLWSGYLRNLLKGLVERTDNKFDDVMFQAIEKIIDTFIGPKKATIETEQPPTHANEK